MLHQYLLDLSIFPKYKNIDKEGDITCLLWVTVQGGFRMEIYASKEACVFARDVIGPIRRCTIVEKLAVIVLQRIMNPFFVFLDLFSV